MSRKELAKRYVLFIVSLFFAALGVAVTKHGELGVSPISSVANVMSDQFTALSLGEWLILWNCVLILGQVVIRRREFETVQLLQVPLSFLFGWFTDFGSWLVAGIPVEVYPVRLLLVLAGTVILGFGISLAVLANVVMNSGEAFVKALSDKLWMNFGNVKIGFDVFCVVLAVLLSLLFFHRVVGTREGTVLAALLTGQVVKFFVKRVRKPVEKLLMEEKEMTGDPHDITS